MNATAVPTRTLATFALASHTYVQQVRDALAEFVIEQSKAIYKARLQSGPQLLWEITTLLVDETDFVLRVGTDRGPPTHFDDGRDHLPSFLWHPRRTTRT